MGRLKEAFTKGEVDFIRSHETKFKSIIQDMKDQEGDNGFTGNLTPRFLDFLTALRITDNNERSAIADAFSSLDKEVARQLQEFIMDDTHAVAFENAADSETVFNSDLKVATIKDDYLKSFPNPDQACKVLSTIYDIRFKSGMAENGRGEFLLALLLHRCMVAFDKGGVDLAKVDTSNGRISMSDTIEVKAEKGRLQGGKTFAKVLSWRFYDMLFQQLDQMLKKTKPNSEERYLNVDVDDYRFPSDPMPELGQTSGANGEIYTRQGKKVQSGIKGPFLRGMRYNSSDMDFCIKNFKGTYTDIARHCIKQSNVATATGIMQQLFKSILEEKYSDMADQSIGNYISDVTKELTNGVMEVASTQKGMTTEEARDLMSRIAALDMCNYLMNSVTGSMLGQKKDAIALARKAGDNVGFLIYNTGDSRVKQSISSLKRDINKGKVLVQKTGGDRRDSAVGLSISSRSMK